MNTLTFDFTLRLFAAAIMGAAIGLERGYRAKEAGFRTHFLVAMGSSLFMILSQYGFEQLLFSSKEAGLNVRLDPSRIAAQVVSGIGFIGAGTIIFQKHMVRGLTTAAGLWVTSTIGMTCGAGMFTLAITTTVMVLICLEALNFLFQHFGTRNIVITFSTSTPEEAKNVLEKMQSEGMTLESYNMHESHRPDASYIVSVEVNVKRNRYESHVHDILEHLDGVSIESIE